MSFKTPNQYYQSNKPFMGLLGLAASGLYGVVSQLNLYWRKRQQIKLPAHCPPIISIGNLTTGGTGKTPFVIGLAQYYESLGKRCLILTRGYGGKTNPNGSVTSSLQGDEAWLIQSSLHHSLVLASPNRTQLLQTYLAESMQPFKADVIILEDGFQYQALPRHCDIVLIDGTKGLGNGYLLPAGPLREPLSALKRADIIILTKQIHPTVKKYIETCLQHLQHYIPVWDCPFDPTNSMKLLGKDELYNWQNFLPQTLIGTIAGIAQPDDFIQTITANSPYPVIKSFIYADHHVYTNNDIDEMIHWLEADERRIIITTSKDAIKLSAFSRLVEMNRTWVQEIEPIFSWQTLVESRPLLKQAKPHNNEYASI